MLFVSLRSLKNGVIALCNNQVNDNNFNFVDCDLVVVWGMG